MKEYPSTSKEFKVNEKIYTMKKFTLGLQSKIEDDNISVTLVEALKTCTNMSEDDILGLDVDQLDAIYLDIREFTYTPTDPEGEGEPKKP